MGTELIELLEEKPLKERLKLIIKGLKAPRDSGEFRFARFELLRLFGPSTLSILIGAGVAAGLLVFAVGQQLSSDSEVEVTVVEMETVKLDDIKIEEIKPEEMEEVDVTVDTTVVAPPSEYSAPSDTPGVGVDGDKDTPMVAFAPVMTRSPLVMKSLYGNRTKGGRNTALSSYGGSSVTEASVIKALRWLKEHQKPDGSWDSPPIAMTGLALLTYLAHGETPASEEFGPTVEKAIKYLLSKQSANGSWSPNTYQNGIACYAMSEAFAMTKIMAIREAMEKGVEFIIKGQHEKGGFHYVYNAPTWDMSCCGWQFQAFKAAKMAGATNPDLEQAIKRSINLMKEWSYSNVGEAGGWGYSGGYEKPGGGVSWTMTSAGTLCMQLLGQAKSKQVRNGIKYLEPQVCKWPEKAAKDAKAKGTAAVYGWYYLTQAKFQEGGSTWNNWNKQFSRELVQNQEEDGHWEGGDHDPGSHVYTTTLCALMLQVYYRYLPSYKHVEDEAGGAADVLKSDDISVSIL
jgi:hypothetical protein